MPETIDLGVIASALNLEVAEFEKLKKDGEKDRAPEDYAKAVAGAIKTFIDGTIERTKTGAFNEGHGKGMREALKNKEAELQSKYKVEGKTVDEMFENVLKSAGTVDWTKDPNVQTELRNREEKLSKVQEDLEKERSSYRKNLIKIKLERKVPDLLKSKNFLIPEDQKRASTLMGVLLDKIESDGVEIREDGDEFVPWHMEKNDRLKTDDYKPVTFDDYVLSKASLIFDQNSGSGHKSPGDKNDPPPGRGNGANLADLSTIKTWPDVYKAKAAIRPTDEDAKTKLAALDAHVQKLQAAGTLK